MKGEGKGYISLIITNAVSFFSSHLVVDKLHGGGIGGGYSAHGM